MAFSLARVFGRLTLRRHERGFGCDFLAGILLRGIPLVLPYLPGAGWVRLAFVTLVAFGGIAINQVPQPFFGMTFQLLLAAAALLALAHFFSQERIYWLPPVLLVVLGLMWWLVTAKFSFAFLLIGIVVGVWCWWRVPSWRLWPGCFCARAFALLCWKGTQVAPYHNYRERTLLEAGEARGA
ncbi:MAG: hypothetical protein N2035_09420 [Chthoniobacterales bacterium]|nr:hypothetical protein [Chthoniobacterales bacterium]